MIKLVSLFHRRPGMTKEEFIAYYEQYHRKIGEKVLGGYATRYVRRYLTSAAEVTEDDPDVLMEIWFPDRATHDACFAAIAEPDQMAEILADEERLFDRSRMRSFTVEEYESDMTGVKV
jgi:hypothetical protein